MDRAVIAIPLLEQMKPDLELIDKVSREHPGIVQKFNAALRLNPEYQGGIESAMSRAQSMVQLAISRTRESLNRRLGRTPAESRQDIEKIIAEFEACVVNPTLESASSGSSFALVNLHAAVVQRLEALNSAEPEPCPIAKILPRRFEVLIDVNLEFLGGRDAARDWISKSVAVAKERAGVKDPGQGILREKSQATVQYLFARLEARVIQELVKMDFEQAAKQRDAHPSFSYAKFRAIYHIWPDFEVSATILKSKATVKADAAQNSFSARGANITWAIMDSGIDAGHIHFRKHGNVPHSPWHKDFTTDGSEPLLDENGHGTHVSGILAGEWIRQNSDDPCSPPIAISRSLKTDSEDVEYQETKVDSIGGMAPECKLISLKVLDEGGKGSVSNLIAAIAHVQELNGHGRRLLIQGVNMSLGYNFEPEWFACGQSPLCVEVNRLVKTGVVVVVAAGNTGYGTIKASTGASAAGLALTINDPGNADLAITVGSTHRDMPHAYGVSYFSSKGPTGDGRLKPDLIAPGEKIISCAAGKLRKYHPTDDAECDYVENSGTSMAAPHVSGVIAAFLSVRPEFVGQAERVKEIFVSTATDLHRDRYFQGAGLVDLMRAIQTV
ncbi:MAG TPA: S8 family peptidase [Verrucomicrobiae bacterium]|nr:S8 family peptidase [Verrucomicrobiae bacterium]